MARSGDKVKGIQSRIPADLILRAMVGLLESRRANKIKRITFLKVWGRLRRLLALTPEYARWRWEVKTRAGGACERCAEVGDHAHHKEPVARNPARALDLSNGEFLCRRCHRAEHRSHARDTHKVPSSPASSRTSPSQPVPTRRSPTPRR